MNSGVDCSIFSAIKSDPKIVHEFLNGNDINYIFIEDVALITLQNLYVNPKLRPVCIPMQTSSTAIGDSWIGQTITISGWGDINETESLQIDILQHATLEIIGIFLSSQWPLRVFN